MNKAEQTKNKYLKSIYSVIQAELKQMVKQLLIHLIFI